MSLPNLPPSVTRVQGLVTFCLIAVVGITLGLRTEIQQDSLRRQATEIGQNALRIQEAQYQSCLGGVRILLRFNAQQDALAKIEGGLARDPAASAVGRRVALERVHVYEAARVLPLPTCVRGR